MNGWVIAQGQVSQPSRSPDEVLDAAKKRHERERAKMLARIKDFGYVIKFSKCNFMVEKVKFLGVQLSAPGKIEIDPEFVEALDRIRLPTTTKELRGFLGIFNWRAHFVPNFIEASYVLYQLFVY